MRVPGAFAEAVAVREKNLHLLPDRLSFDEASLAEPLAVCIHSVKLGLQRTGSEKISALVLGGGAIGILCTMILDQFGVHHVEIAETNALRRKTLAEVTPARPYDPAQDRPKGPVDLVLDCVGSGITRKTASEMAKPGGTIVHIGLQDNLEGLDTRRITLQEIAFLGTYCYTNQDFSDAIDLLANAKISRQGWSEIRSLSEGGAGFLDIHNGKAAAKIILEI